MLPRPEDRPAVVAQISVDCLIPCDVALELRKPIAGVGPGLGSVDWTAVPEAPIDEDGHPCSSENDVGANQTVARSDRQVLAEPVAASMEHGAKPGLGTAVCAPVLSHSLGNLLTCWLGVRERHASHRSCGRVQGINHETRPSRSALSVSDLLSEQPIELLLDNPPDLELVATPELVELGLSRELAAAFPQGV